MRYDPALDGLRAVAVVLVVLTHAMSAAVGGWIGVDIFFVLSGFLITRLLIEELDRSGRIAMRNFYMRRFLRLGPPFLILLLVYAGLALSVLPHGLDHLKAIFWAGTYLMSWVAALGHGQQGLLLHTWSLSIEEQFYLFWPWLLILVPRQHRLATALALAASSALWRNWLVFADAVPLNRAYFAFDTRAETLLIGAALALIPQFSSRDRVKRLLAAAWPVPVCLILAITSWRATTQAPRSTASATRSRLLSRHG